MVTQSAYTFDHLRSVRESIFNALLKERLSKIGKRDYVHSELHTHTKLHIAANAFDDG